MYKLFSLLLCLLFTGQMYALPITPDGAMRNAKSFLASRLAKSNMAFASGNLKLERADKGGSEFYVFNIDDNKGYVIVSADDSAEPILGYVPQGNWQPENIPDNMKQWLGGYSKDIKALKSIRKGMLYSTGKKRPVRKPLNALLSCKWYQGEPYNRFTPDFGDGFGNRPTGCVATALAMVMYYHKWPQGEIKGIPSYKYIDYAMTGGDDKMHTIESLPSVTFDWESMTDEYGPYSDDKSCDAVAVLMRYCGQAVRMMYGKYVSGAMSFDLPEALVKYFGYDKGARYVDRDEYSTSQWEELVYNEIAEGRPVLYSGATVRNEGHQFVCDGYDDGFFHINWGWGGMSDGYFRLSVLDPGTQGTGGATSGLNFCEGQQIITGVCKPLESSEEPWQGPSVSYIRLQNQNNVFKKDAIGNIKGISVKSHFAYSKVTDDMYDVGYGILDTDGNLTRVIHKKKFSFTAGLNDRRHDYSASLRLTAEDIPADGVYSIRAVYVEKGSDEWKIMRNSDQKYLKVAVDGNYAEITEVPETKVEISEINIKGDPFVDNMLTLTALVKNIGGDIESDLKLSVNGKLTEVGTSLDLANGRSERVRIPLIFTSKDIFEKTLEIPYSYTDNGTAELCFYLNSRQVSDVVKVNVTNSEATFANLSIEPVKAFVSAGDSLVIPISVTNNSKKNFYNVVKCVLAEKKATGKYYYLSESSALLNLNSGEKTDVTFKFNELILNKDYYVYFNLYSYGNEVKYPDDVPVYYGPYTTPDALVYWDYEGRKSYMIPAENGKYELPSGICAIELPNNISKTDIPVSDNSNCVYYFKPHNEVPAEMQDKNIVISGSAKQIIIDDSKPFYAPFMIKAEHAEFSYTNKTSEYSTLILPFTPHDNVDKMAVYYSAESEDSVWFDNESEIQTAIPYIIKNNDNKIGTTIFTGDNVEVTGICTTTKGEIHTVYGTMTGMVADGSEYVFDGKDFEKTKAGDVITPFSMYLRSTTGAEKIGVSLPSDFITNDINVVNTDRQESHTIYTLDGMAVGRSLNGLKHGIYVINGKKVIR